MTPRVAGPGAPQRSAETATADADGGADGAPRDEGAGVLIQRGFDSFREGDGPAAAASFRAALATGGLNDAGRALAYWHIYLAQREGAVVGDSIDALCSFVTVAQDLLAMRRAPPRDAGEQDAGDFVARFDLQRRLTRARAMLSAAWVAESRGAGRDAATPVLVHDAAERDLFLQLMPPCATPQRRRVRRQPLHRGAEAVELSCDGEAGAARYFFETIGDNAQ